MASRSSAPVMAPCQKESTFSTTRTLPMVVSNRAPSAAPQTVPVPPVIATPPTTTALTTVSSQPCALSATTVPKRASHRAPAKPATAPEKAYAARIRRRIGIPASRAASGLDPIAYSSRPER
jgi:hypothetical protein